MPTTKDDSEARIFEDLPPLTGCSEPLLTLSEQYTLSQVLQASSDAIADTSSNRVTNPSIAHHLRITTINHAGPPTEDQKDNRRDIRATSLNSSQQHTKRQKLGETNYDCPSHALARISLADPIESNIKQALSLLNSSYKFMIVPANNKKIMVLAKPTLAPRNACNTKDLETKLAMIYRHFHPDIQQPHKHTATPDENSATNFKQYHNKALLHLNMVRINVYHLQDQFFYITNCQNLIQPTQVLPTKKPTVNDIYTDISFDDWANSMWLLHSSSWVPESPAIISWQTEEDDTTLIDKKLMIETSSTMTPKNLVSLFSLLLPPTIDKRYNHHSIRELNPESDFRTAVSSKFKNSMNRLIIANSQVTQQRHDDVSAGCRVEHGMTM